MIFHDRNINNSLDYQPLFGKRARAPPPHRGGGGSDQKRESGGNRAYINNEQTENCNQDDTVYKLIVEVILYGVSTFVFISIFRFLKPFPLTFVLNLVLQ